MHGIITEKTNLIATVYDHKKDMRLSIQLNRWMMEMIGAWPKSIAISWVERYAYALLNASCIGFIIFLVVPAIMYIVLEMDNSYLILRLCGALSFSILAIVKYISLIFHEKDIRNGIEHIEKDWMDTRNYDDRIIMIRSANFGQRLVSICAFFMYGGAVFFYIARPFITGKITEDGGNLTYQPLVYPVARVIADTRRSPVGEIFFWVQCLSGFITHAITASGCSLAAAFAMHAYGRMEILIQWIKHLIDGRKDLCDNMNQRLAMIVEQHVRILNFISLTDKVLREISIVEIVQCTEWESNETTSYITYFILLLSFIFNIFILCYIGELVAEKYKKIGEIAYMIDWYRLSGRKGIDVILMMAMSNMSIKLTAGNFFELSLSIFGNVIKTSTAYFNMLRTFNI